MRKPRETVPHTFRLSEEILGQLKDAARQDLRSMNCQLEALLRQALAERQNAKGPHTGGPFAV